MKRFIGTKIVNAKPMSRLKYNQLRGWNVPADENPADEGYLVEYQDGGRANVDGYAGYISWSPKDVFEGSYRETSGLSFGQALEAIKGGFPVARVGWNGKGMCVYLNRGAIDANAGVSEFVGGVPRALFETWGGGIVTRMPNFVIKSADGSNSTWVPSITDALAEDWQIVE